MTFGFATICGVTALVEHPAGPLAGSAPAADRTLTYREFRHIEALGQRGFAASAGMAYLAAVALGGAALAAKRAEETP